MNSKKDLIRQIDKNIKWVENLEGRIDILEDLSLRANALRIASTSFLVWAVINSFLSLTSNTTLLFDFSNIILSFGIPIGSGFLGNYLYIKLNNLDEKLREFSLSRSYREKKAESNRYKQEKERIANETRILFDVLNNLKDDNTNNMSISEHTNIHQMTYNKNNIDYNSTNTKTRVRKY